MQKDFYSDIAYNREKRRSSIILSSLLTLVALGTASIFILNKDWVYMGVFVAMSLLPIALLPISFKTYPVHGKSIVTVTDKDITVMGETVSIKDITKIKVLIELPPCGDDRESVKQLEDMKFVHPGYEVYGNLDMFYIGKDGKKKTAYSHITNVIEALEDMLLVGVKNYSVTYTCKKNTSISEFDFKTVVNNKKQEEFAKVTKKQKTKGLI